MKNRRNREKFFVRESGVESLKVKVCPMLVVCSQVNFFVIRIVIVRVPTVQGEEVLVGGKVSFVVRH